MRRERFSWSIGVRRPLRALGIATALVWLGCASLPQFFGQAGDAGQPNDGSPSDDAGDSGGVTLDECKRVFLLGTEVSGDFAADGGDALELADQWCAAAAPTKVDGGWRALLRMPKDSDDMTAFTRVAPSSGPWCNMRRELLFTNLGKTSAPPATAPFTLADGGLPDASVTSVWTGIGNNKGQCSGWNSDAGGQGRYGEALVSGNSPYWANAGETKCTTEGFTLYCFEQ